MGTLDAPAPVQDQNPQGGLRPVARIQPQGAQADIIAVATGSELISVLQSSPARLSLSLHHVRFLETVSVELAEDEGYILQLTLSGSARAIIQADCLEACPGDFMVINPAAVSRRTWEQWSEHLFVRIGSLEIERAVGAELGDHSRRKVSFSEKPESAENAPTLLNYVRLLNQDLNSSQALSNPTASKLCLEMMSSLMLRLLPNDKQHHIQTSRSPATPYYVRRAIDYASKRFGEPISLRDMAVAAGVCSRTLDKGFRRFCDKSPMEHLRSVRLENARAKLMNPLDELTTVRSTARLCGFRHLGRFAEYYARQFGELPSQTLVRQQRSGAPLMTA